MNHVAALVGFAVLMICSTALAQVECSGWGEMRGIRVDGELMPVRTTLVIASPGWQRYAQTAHWRTRQQGYVRGDDGAITSTGEVGWDASAGLRFKQTFRDVGPGEVAIEIEASATAAITLEAVYVFVSVPEHWLDGAVGEISGVAKQALFATTRPASDKHYIAGTSEFARFKSKNNSVAVTTTQPVPMVFQDDRGNAADPRLTLFFPIHSGDLLPGQSARASFSIATSLHPGTWPATVTVDTRNRGRAFDGIGGNFCWGTQSPTVNFYLDNLRIAWGRVNVPLQHWQPDEHSDPTTRAPDAVHPEIAECLRMAGELHRRKIPIIASAWNAPPWAYERPDPNRPRRRGGHIHPAKWAALATSIGSYLLNFKRVVGAEPDMFSFNEPNIGINVLQSPEEHRDSIKLLGRHFESIGLKTKLLLGDANEPRAVDFVEPTLADPEAMRYVAAISYHSWNDGTDEQLRGWGDHATRAGLPLLVAEAGPDPDAHHYRAILNEPWYALDEVALNLRCLNLSQPATIMHWQLTPDYGFVTENAGAIAMTQRWFNYKQLDQLTPAGAAILSVESSQPHITGAALAGLGQSVGVVHLSNTGRACDVEIKGLTVENATAAVYVTDATRSIQRMQDVQVTFGRAKVSVPSQAFVSLVFP